MNRCKAFLAALHERGDSAAVLHRSDNMRWLTGYTGEGCVFVCDDAWVVITDFRYIEQVERQAPECSVLRVNYGTGFSVTENDHIAQLCKEHGIKSLCVESDFLSYDEYVKKQNALSEVELKPVGGLCEELRIYKDAEEIENIRKACDISSRAFESILPMLHAGMTEKQAMRVLENAMADLGGEKLAFDTIAAAGVNGSLPHAIPGDNIIREGDLLTLDFGTTVNGYCADMTRTVGFGKVNYQLKAMYNDVLTAQLMALDAVKPGVACSEVDKVARDFLDAKYPGAFGHGLGHGVGLFIHEEPRFGAKSKDFLKPGVVITVEPGVYIPGVGGVRIEDTIAITQDGYINLVTAPKQLIEL